MLEGLDEEGCVEELGHMAEKKRRLSVDQVKALEKNFEVENKLDPERKVKLAQELGLQPRQVAVWFQNRRARWKTKQLERDYGVLKANYDSLKHNYDRIQHDNEALLKEIKELKSKLNEEDSETDGSVKEEEKDEKLIEQSNPILSSDDTDLNYENLCKNNNNEVMMGSTTFFPDFKDGSSDSDSSAILNEDHSPTQFTSPTPTPTMNCLEFSEVKPYQPQFVKIEEHNFLGGDEDCNFFSDDQPPTFPWYSHDPWN